MRAVPRALPRVLRARAPGARGHGQQRQPGAAAAGGDGHARRVAAGRACACGTWAAGQGRVVGRVVVVQSAWWPCAQQPGLGGSGAMQASPPNAPGQRKRCIWARRERFGQTVLFGDVVAVSISGIHTEERFLSTCFLCLQATTLVHPHCGSAAAAAEAACKHHPGQPDLRMQPRRAAAGGAPLHGCPLALGPGVQQPARRAYGMRIHARGGASTPPGSAASL